MKRALQSLFLLFVFFTSGFSLSAKVSPDDYTKLPANINFWSNYDNEILAKAITERMTDEELLSQVLMFGWTGQRPGGLLKNWVSEVGLGSVKIFGWNTENLSNVALSVKELQKLAAGRPFKIPLFVATDQEGGWIRHVKGDTSDTPGNLSIGASGYLTDAYYSSYYINKEIKALGINMNFAPSIDIYTDLNSSIIGPRSFGSDAEKVAALGEAFALGASKAGVIATAKHFPGHGDTEIDSHGRLPQINIDRETFEKRELLPFKKLIQANVPAIMSGHLSFPEIDPSGAPASLSKVMLTDILRNQLGYKGLIITDDIMMNGASQYSTSVSRSLTLALQAGNDIVMSSSTASLSDQMWTRNIQLLKTSPDFKKTVKEHVYRILLKKMEYFKSDNAASLYPDENKISESIPDREGEKFFLDQSCRSTTLYRGQLPLDSSQKRILLVGYYQDFFNQGQVFFPSAQVYRFPNTLRQDLSNLSEYDAVTLKDTAASFSVIIVNVYDQHSALIAESLKDSGKKIIILSTLSPVPVLNFDWADTILLGYSYSKYSYQALFAALRGDYKPQGHFPLEK